MDSKIAKTNFDFCKETMALKSELEMSYLQLGQRLGRIVIEKMYEPNYETFDEFLEEIKLSRATASKLINVYSKFIFEFKIRPQLLAEAGGWSKVAEILPFAENKSQAEAWLQKAKHITQSDLRKEIKEAKTGISMAGCKHVDCEVITFRKCRTCGDTERIYDKEK